MEERQNLTRPPQQPNSDIDESSIRDVAAIRRRIESLLAASAVVAPTARRRRFQIDSDSANALPRRRTSAPLPIKRLTPSLSSDSGPDMPPDSEESSSSEDGADIFISRLGMTKVKGVSTGQDHMPGTSRTITTMYSDQEKLASPEHSVLKYSQYELPRIKLVVANASKLTAVSVPAVSLVSPIPEQRDTVSTHENNKSMEHQLQTSLSQAMTPVRSSALSSLSSSAGNDVLPIAVTESDDLIAATIHLQLLTPVFPQSVQRSLQSLMSPNEPAAEPRWRYEPTPSPSATGLREKPVKKTWHSADDISAQTTVEHLSIDSGFQRSGDSIPASRALRRVNSGSASITKYRPDSISAASTDSKASETHFVDFPLESDQDIHDNGLDEINILRRSPDLAEWNEQYLIRCLNAIHDPDALSQAEIESLMDAGAVLPIDRLLSKRPELESLLPIKEIDAVETIDENSKNVQLPTMFSTKLGDKTLVTDRFPDKLINGKSFKTTTCDGLNYSNNYHDIKDIYGSEPILNAVYYSQSIETRQEWDGKENVPAHRKIRSDSNVRAPPPPYGALATGRFHQRPHTIIRSSSTQTDANDLWQTAHKAKRCVVDAAAVRRETPKINPSWARNSAPRSILRREQQQLLKQQQYQRQQQQIQSRQQYIRQQCQQQLKQQQQLWHQQQKQQRQLRLQQINQHRQEAERQMELRQDDERRRLKKQQEWRKKQRYSCKTIPIDLNRIQPAFALGEESETDTFIRFIDKENREILMTYLVSEDKDPRRWRQFVAQQRTPAPGDVVSRNRINADSKMQIIHSTDENNNSKQQRPVIKSLTQPNDYQTKLPTLQKTANGNAPPPIMTVSGNHCCAHCEAPLGRGAAMIVEALNLFYHLSCFRCNVCSMALGNGTRGADVRVRGHRLYCQKCFSDH